MKKITTPIILALMIIGGTIWFTPPGTVAQAIDSIKFTFGFKIDSEDFCICSINTRYTAKNLGLPKPLPPDLDGDVPGDLVSLPFYLKPVFSALPFVDKPKEYRIQDIEEDEWVLGQTHGPAVPGLCLDLAPCEQGVCCNDRKWGWLWEKIGSNKVLGL